MPGREKSVYVPVSCGHTNRMKKPDWLKALKIAAGCSLAFLAVRRIGLSHPTSVITITLLSILNTRRDTFGIAKKRFLAFFLSSLLAVLIFPLFRYSVFALLLYLFFCFLLCERLHVSEGFSMSTVLLLHLWRAKSFAPGAYFNELCLMALGVLAGFAMNLYMPSRIKQIHAAREQIEALMRDIFSGFALGLFDGASLLAAKTQLAALERKLKDGFLHAKYTEENYIFRDMQYYTRYLAMRNKQCLLLVQLQKSLSALPPGEALPQRRLTASFFAEISVSLHEHNNATGLLASLEQLRRTFSHSPLPACREEFKARAILYASLNIAEELLLLKKDFVEALTEAEKRRFWETAR